MITYIIQEEVKVDQEWIDKLIERYEKHPSKFKLAFGDFCGNKDDIIREIKSMTDVGKKIMKMEYKFEEEFPKFLKKFEKTPFGKAGKELKELLGEQVTISCTGKERKGMSSKGINISQVFDDELAKLTDKNITKICKDKK